MKIWTALIVSLAQCVISGIHFWIWISVLIKHASTSQGEMLKCPAGDEVSFECPCCPEEFDDCRFKKLIKGGYIVRDGVFYNGARRFQMNENKTHITLQECREDDEGTYVWMCGRCNVNRNFHLEVQESFVDQHPLNCSIGGEVTFESPCSDDFKTCTFKKLERDGYIVRRGGVTVNDFKYKLEEIVITLNQCNEDDVGTYEWICGECRALRKLKVYRRHDREGKEKHNGMSHAESTYSFMWLIIVSSIITLLTNLNRRDSIS